MTSPKYLSLLITIIIPVSSRPNPNTKFQNDPICNVSQSLINEIQSYQPIANQIISTVLNGTWKGRTYSQVARFVDLHPTRLTGGQGLENAIDYMIAKLTRDGLEHVHTENATVTHWIRGEETAELLTPANKKLHILGLGPSVGTPNSGLIAEVLVVHNFTELDSKKDLVPGRIVVYNTGWDDTYGDIKNYRRYGASIAAQYGAVAVLVESITPFSLDTPHTGSMFYNESVTKIPAASITREDAQLLSRLDEYGEKITIKLKMLDELLEPTVSRNTFAEITGREYPAEIVAVSGHIDAWDVGQGAQDDAGGCMISVEALAVLKHLGLQPRRTLQVILWTAEEQYIEGAEEFIKNHRGDMPNYKAVFESDAGTFRPKGLDFAGTPEAGCIIQEILKLVEVLNATEYARYEHVGTDIAVMTDEGVPSLSLNNEDDKYFWFHHSAADTMMWEDPEELDLGTALWAVASFVLADMSETLPREK